MTGPVVVIGAGLAGLAAAIHLAAAGRDVTVLEASDGPGGCCGTASVGPYRFDTGPSVLTMPGVIEETIGAAGEDLASWLPLTELDPYYRLAFHDGSHLDVLPGAERMAAEVSRLSGAREAARYLRFRRQLELLLEAEWAPFVARDFRHLSDLIQLRATIRLARLGALRRMNGLAAHYLTDWRLIRAHTFQALYVGLDPARAPGIYSIVSTMDTVGGVHIPARGGMHAVPLALADVAAKAGAGLRYSTKAERVLGGHVRDNRCAAGRWRTASRVECDRGR
jgi:phytoene desaturase